MNIIIPGQIINSLASKSMHDLIDYKLRKPNIIIIITTIIGSPF